MLRRALWRRAFHRRYCQEKGARHQQQDDVPARHWSKLCRRPEGADSGDAGDAAQELSKRPVDGGDPKKPNMAAAAGTVYQALRRRCEDGGGEEVVGRRRSPQRPDGRRQDRLPHIDCARCKEIREVPIRAMLVTHGGVSKRPVDGGVKKPGMAAAAGTVYPVTSTVRRRWWGRSSGSPAEPTEAGWQATRSPAPH